MQPDSNTLVFMVNKEKDKTIEETIHEMIGKEGSQKIQALEYQLVPVSDHEFYDILIDRVLEAYKSKDRDVQMVDKENLKFKIIDYSAVGIMGPLQKELFLRGAAVINNNKY